MLRFFGLWREVKRLLKEKAELRAEIKDLRAENRRLAALVLERDILLVDRILTTRVKTFAVGEEAEARVEQRNETIRADADKEYVRQEAEFLSGELEARYRDADEAGVSRDKAYLDYKKDEPGLIDQYRRSLGFG